MDRKGWFVVLRSDSPISNKWGAYKLDRVLVLKETHVWPW